MIIAFLLSTNSRDSGLFYYTRTLIRELAEQGIKSFITHTVSCVCDLLHVQHVFGYNDKALLKRIKAVRKKGVSVFITLHSLNHVLTREQEGFIKAVGKECDCLCVHFKYQRAIIQKYLGKQPNIEVITYPAEAEKKKKNNRKGKTVLLCGFFRPTKGFHRVVALFPEVVKKVPDAQLLIAGAFSKGAWSIYKRDFFEAIRRSSVRNRIVLKNRLFSEKQFLNFIDAARVVVLPYESGEHAGIFHQCIARGKQMITSDLPGFIEKKHKMHYIVRNDKRLAQTLVFCLRH
ncbi:MAG: hypothetical protein A2350_03945 [Candidatus Raymondbacteria bacterium RifOxyB12_full_50_8]|uniref:Uncharacterized protein n=1 Tax=Candidatus Raymondbacteria bacterium RIFOXYD12_FULL_49_13 TaxID=1817890 RepID=A0A1F7EZH7_UNCRA|nr:MAG: hypothetical protein A2350_03945 [Candidatus Raymondbacteria bacterium RifOxyB12_full_50_8]OGJ99777.1 MAG: hypothetical protein A2519_12600 [Candidatus Raymondbacteria bacterium RIFOXYD12_FULL_49_13]